MIRKYFIVLFILLSTNYQFLLFAQTSRWLSVGTLHSWYSSSGCEVELGRLPGVISNQQDGLRWPALYLKQDCQVSKGIWFGSVNYNDIKAGKLFNHKVVHNGPRTQDIQNEFLPQEFKLVGRFNRPKVYVNGIPAGKLDFLDSVDVIDPNLPSDRMIYNVINTGMGITMIRKIYSFGQQNHDNYFIYDYVFKNTGIIDKNGTINEQTLNDVVFYFLYRYAPSKEGGPYGYKWLPQNTAWGRSTMYDVIYEKDRHPFRAQYSWLGKHSHFTEGSSIGGPNIGSFISEPDGRLGAAQFLGVITLHADTSPSDDTDDLLQPMTTGYYDSDGPLLFGNDQYNAEKMSQEYALMTSGRAEYSHADKVGISFADQFGSTGGGYSQGQGFGTYTIAPGDSIHIVLSEAVAGLNRDSIYSIGGKWLKGTGPFIKPDGTIASDRDEYKDAWVMTGKDSLFKTFERASYAFKNNLIIPQPPPPPSEFYVNEKEKSVSLTWSNNAESSEKFSGYRIYRAINSPDTNYSLIFECGGSSGNNIVNSFEDSLVSGRNKYYYCITSFDDGSANDLYPGVPLESSKFYTMTYDPIQVTQVIDYKLNTEFKLEQNYPNPFNPTTTISYFLPKRSYVLLKILDVLGNEVETLIDRTQPMGNYKVNFNASSLASGMYFYRLQTLNFSKTKKMILMR